MRQIYCLVAVLFLIFSCSTDSGIELGQGNSNRNNNRSSSDADKEQDIIEGVSPERLATLFFDEAYIFRPQKTKVPVKKYVPVKKVTPTINPAEYKVIADWMVSNRRHIKVKNLRTNVEIIVKEGQKTGEIILIERTFFTYKLKIQGQIIEVAR